MKFFEFGSRFKIVFHVLLGLLLGGGIALVYLTSSETFRRYLQLHIEDQFRRDYGCLMRGSLERIDWFSCSMTFSGIQITPLMSEQRSLTQLSSESLSKNLPLSNLRIDHGAVGSESWSIFAETLKIKGSWMSLLLLRQLKVSMLFEHVIMLEVFDKVPEGLLEFCKKIFGQVIESSIAYDDIAITDGLLYLKRSIDGLSMQVPYSCNLRSEKNSTRVQLYVHDGSIGYPDGSWMKELTGSILCDVPYYQPFSTLSGQVQLNYLFAKTDTAVPGFFAGKIDRGFGEFTMKTEDGSVVINPIKVRCNQYECWCDVMVTATAAILRYFDVPDVFSDVAGKVGIQIQCDLYNFFQTLQASIVLHDILYKMQPMLPGGKVVITDHHSKGFSGVFQMYDQAIFEVDVCALSEVKELKGHNVVDLSIVSDRALKILKNRCSFSIVCDKDGVISGKYDIALHHGLLEKEYLLSGTFILKDGSVKFEGMLDDVVFDGTFQIFPEYVFHSFQAKRKDMILIDLSTDPVDSSLVVGSVDFSVVHDVVPEPLKMSFAQEGSFVFRGSFKDGKCFANVQTHFAHIRVPYIYNVIQNIAATCECNIHEKKLVIKDVEVQWYEGAMSCSQATVYFDKNLHWNFIHAPLLFQKVMLSWNKSIYGLVSGRLLFSSRGHDEKLNLEGQLMIQKSELKENIFSTEFQEILLGLSGTTNDFNDQGLQAYVDVSIFTKEPLQVSTSFLTAQALIDMRIQGLLSKVEVSGSINLTGGSLCFPYKSLDIVEGRLLFVPEQPLDPVIELVAKGRLKRFQVMMRAWGSALDPHFQFESQPYLSEEQIVSLLLLGVEDQSLGMMVPAFLTQRLKDLIFGPAISNPKLKSMFDRLLQSLKYIRFLPQFTSQAGRGGVRGIIEIDASDHLHGKIDTNFAQLEDTKFDIDYLATDDVTLRLQKDGPSTYGGEVEFCWKFS